MILFLEVLIALAIMVAAVGLLALVQLGLLLYYSVLTLGANLTEGETPERLGASTARGCGPRKPSALPARAVSEQPHPGGPGSAVDPQVSSDPPVLEVRRAPGITVATIQRGWNHAKSAWTLDVRPER